MTHLLKILFFVFFPVLIWANPSIAQEAKIEYPYKHYTVQDGLVQMQIQALYQDSKGYLWCGTKTGISRFDGRSFKNYSGVNLKQDGPVCNFAENCDNNILVFNKSNITQITKDTIENFKYPDSYFMEQISNIKSQQNCMLIATKQEKGKNNWRRILNYTNPDSLHIVELDISFGNIFYFDENNKNQVWTYIGDSLFIINLLKNKIVKSFPKQGINQLKYLGDTLYAFSVSNGIYKLVGDSFIQIEKYNFKQSHLKIISSPDNKSLIIKTEKNLYQFKDKLQLIKKDMTLIRDIMFDHEDNLWVATEEGLYNFFQLNFVNYTFGMGNKDWVWSILEDDKKNMWFSSFQNGLWKWDGNKVTDYTKLLNGKKQQESNINYPYNYFMGASKFGSKLFFPTNYNIITYDGTKFGTVRETTNTWNAAFFITKTTVDGTFYCGGMSGLFTISEKGKTKFWKKDSLGISTILSVETDKNKNITVIGSTGISQIINDSIVHTQIAQSNNYCSTKDHLNNIWIGGNQNLSLKTKDSIINVVPNSTELYFSLLFVEPHYLLIGGLNGMYLANLNHFYENNIFEPVLYNQNNGFTGIECGQNGFFKDSEDFVWINTSDLVTRFDPKKLIERKHTHPNLFVSTSTSTDNINWNNVQTDTNICLRYNQNNFRFNVDVVSFSNTGNIRYYYRLNGLQNEWSEASSNNEVTFYNLKPGNYQFSAKVDPGISKAMSETVNINFEIRNPFWLSWWFISCFVVLILFLILTIVYLLNRRIRRQELIKKKIIQLRADALKAQMNPHLIYNALNNINGLINLGRKEQAQEFLNAFSDMLRLVLESTNQNEITLNNEFNIIKSFIEFHKQAKAFHFTYEINSSTKESLNNILIPPMLIQPYVENAILHGIFKLEERIGFIRIEATEKNNRLIITVEDNGVGIGNSQHKGTGLGTKLTQERILLLEKNQDNQVKILQLKKGTRIEINIPLKIKKYENY